MQGSQPKGLFQVIRAIAVSWQQEHIMQVASSLAFASLLAIVPLLAVALSLFTAFPIFSTFEAALSHYLVDQLMPESFSQTVMDYLNTFAQQSKQLSAVGGVFLVVTALLIILSIESALNKIWRIQRPREFSQRLLIFWAFLTLGPLVAGASLWTSTYIAHESLGLAPSLGQDTYRITTLLNIALPTLACTWLFIVAPNCKVLWRHALIGGLVTGITLELIRLGLAYYLKQFPTYAVIYGTFSVLPAFLIWIYLSWLSFLTGATVAATLGRVQNLSSD